MQQTGLTANVSKANLNVTGLTAANRLYNATTVETLGGAATVTALGSDQVTLGGTAVGAFADKNVGTTKAVTVSGNSISGTDAPNYNLIQQTGLTAAVSAFGLTVTATGVNRAYNATSAATVTLNDNRYAGDVVADSYTAASFDNAEIGINKPVTVSGISISGTDAVNYVLNNTTAATTATITAAPTPPVDDGAAYQARQAAIDAAAAQNNNAGNRVNAKQIYNQTTIPQAGGGSLFPAGTSGGGVVVPIYSAIGAFGQAGRQVVAATSLTDVVTLPEPVNSIDYFVRGNALYSNGRTTEAVADYSKAIEENPDFAEAYFNRGLAHEKLNQHREALADFRVAIALQPALAVNLSENITALL